ncbi:MAG: penicillin-binding protein [Verrucomicrobiae bacterium]|nr:penicillin-binding protein [Verrucomicrobiae bacterium]NNJ86697.1 penicillin-binding protein [Akkermansiaceae bacterium]
MSWKPAKEPSRVDRWTPDWVPDWLRALIKWSIRWGLVAFTMLLAVCLFYYYLSWKYDMNDVAKMPEQSVILDRHGGEFSTVHGEKRRLIARDEIPEVMVQALLAREDARFYSHHGVDAKGLVRATLRNIKDMSFTQGASTLSMQLTRNSYDLRAKSLHRKMLEIAVTLRIENRYSKDEILTHYLNRIYFGAGCHGVEEAAQTYFGHSTRELNMGECAMLVGIIRGPHLFSPFRNFEGALAQRDEVLERMMQCHYITEEQLEIAKKNPIRLVAEKDRHTGSSYVRESIRKQLNLILDQQDIRHGGLRIHTTVDAVMQQRMDKALAAPISPLEQGKRSGLQAAALSIDPQSGGILALSGGRDFSESAYNRVNRVRRDLGRMFAPFLDAMALERAKVVIPGQAVQTGRQLGVEETIRLGKRFGFSGPFAKTDDLYRGIVASSPMQLGCAASTLMAKGVQSEPHLIRVITDAEGNVLYEAMIKVNQVISEDAAMGTLELMGDKKEAYIAPTVSRHDAWALLMQKEAVTVLWLGYDQPKAIADHQKVSQALSNTLRKLD